MIRMKRHRARHIQRSATANADDAVALGIIECLSAFDDI